MRRRLIEHKECDAAGMCLFKDRDRFVNLREELVMVPPCVATHPRINDAPRMSPPASNRNWMEWSHAWGTELHLRKALEKLNLEYPHDSDD